MFNSDFDFDVAIRQLSGNDTIFNVWKIEPGGFLPKNKNGQPFVSGLAQGEAPEIANLTYNLVVVNSD